MHSSAAGDNREGAPSRAPSICKEPARFRRQSFPLYSICSSSSFAQRGHQGKNFVLMDLLKSLTGGSTQAEAIPEPLVRPDYPPLFVQNPKPAPYVVTKKKKKFEQAKVASEGL